MSLCSVIVHDEGKFHFESLEAEQLVHVQA